MAKTSKVFTEAALVDSAVYKSFNNNAELQRMIIAAIQDSITIDESYIQEQLMQIRRTRISPLADEVLRAYEEGHIVLLYAKTKRMSQALPFFATKIGGSIKVVVFMNNYGTISQSDLNSSEKYLNIPMKNLYVLLEGAYTSYQYTIYPTKVKKSLGLMRVSTSVYVNMMMRILNKEYAVGVDTDLLYKVSFALGVFFLKTVWGYEGDEIVFSYACNSIKIGTEAVDRNSLKMVFDEYLQQNITNIIELFNFIKTFSTRLESLNFRYLLQWYINTYKPAAIFGLECLPYFLFTIEASMLGSFVVNQPIISDITKNIKGMNTFYPELVKAIS